MFLTRAQLHNVTASELAAMVDKAADCAVQVSDAAVDVIAYACLVAVMAEGPGAHERSENVMAKAAAENGHPAPVVSSAGALARTLHALDAHRIAMVMPYMPDLTKLVSDYIEGAGIAVNDARVLSACVQMPSLDAVQLVEDQLGLPVVTAATATAYETLVALGHEPAIHGAGRLLAGSRAAGVRQNDVLAPAR